jgi:hypothetical protein
MNINATGQQVSETWVQEEVVPPCQSEERLLLPWGVVRREQRQARHVILQETPLALHKTGQ